MIKQPAEWALKAAKAVNDKIDKLRQESSDKANYFAAGDSWGPSISDFRDADESMYRKLALLIQGFAEKDGLCQPKKRQGKSRAKKRGKPSSSM